MEQNLWRKRWRDEVGYSLSIDLPDDIIIVGSFDSLKIGFGGCLLSTNGKSDIFIIKYAYNEDS